MYSNTMNNFGGITKELAKSAALQLKEKLKQPPWLTGGIGVGKCRNSYVIKVYVDKLSDEIRKKIPMSVNNVPVQLAVAGKIEPAEFMIP